MRSLDFTGEEGRQLDDYATGRDYKSVVECGTDGLLGMSETLLPAHVAACS